MRRHKSRPRRKPSPQYNRLRVPRLVSLEYEVVTELGSRLERHAVVSKMLGVAFTRLQLQNLKDKAYFRHPLRRYKGRKNVKTKIVVEKLFASGRSSTTDLQRPINRISNEAAVPNPEVLRTPLF